MKDSSAFKCWVGLLLLALVAAIASRMYYAIVFLPDLRGGWGETWSRLIEFDGWWSCFLSPVGLILNLLWIVPLITAAAMLVWLRNRSSSYDGGVTEERQERPIKPPQFGIKKPTMAGVAENVASEVDDTSASIQGFETPNRMAFRHNRLEASTTIEILTTMAVDP